MEREGEEANLSGASEEELSVFATKRCAIVIRGPARFDSPGPDSSPRFSDEDAQLNCTDENQYDADLKSDQWNHPFCFVMYGRPGC